MKKINKELKEKKYSKRLKQLKKNYNKPNLRIKNILKDYKY